MYNLQQIATEKDELREAVLNARAYKPIYVKIKINYGCNLKCEMCKHWRETMPRVLLRLQTQATNGVHYN